MVMHSRMQSQKENARNSVASGWYPIASHQINMTLAARRIQRTCIFVLGYCENPAGSEMGSSECHQQRLRAQSPDRTFYYNGTGMQRLLHELNAYWDQLLSRYAVSESNDTHVNRMANIWNQYQCMVTFNMSRSASYYESGTGRGMGFRDSCQDLLGFVHLIPERAREAYSGYRVHTVPGWKCLSSVSATDQTGKSGCWKRI